MRIPLFLTVAWAALAASSCADPNVKFNARLAPDFAPQKHSVSVFGIFKEGRMSADTWDDLGQNLSAAFATSACEAEYRDDLLTANAPLSAAIDDYVRANGIGDELLDAVAPAATGDIVIVFTIAGRVIKGANDPTTASMPATAPNTMARGATGFRGSHGTQTAPMGGGPARFGGNANSLDVSASVFSIGMHRSVALVQMQYMGDSLDDAMKKLAGKLQSTLPGATCGGWNANVKLDDGRIRELTSR